MSGEAPYDVVVIGAGAAGLMCAITAGGRGRRVLLLDHSDAPGRKILISGGGRCNFTNLHAGPGNYLSANPKFCRSALSRYRPSDFIALVERHRISYHEKKLGQLFCDGSARAIVRMLLDECRAAGVDLRHPVRVAEVGRTDRFVVGTSSGRFESASLVIATGGLSLPRTGASGFGYEVARRFGHPVTPLAPGLVGLRWAEDPGGVLRGLAGIATPAMVSAGGVGFRENILFTHHGLSGPAILQISNFWSPGDPVVLDFLPDGDIGRLRAEAPGLRAEAALRRHLPARLAGHLAGAAPAGKPLAQMSRDEMRGIEGNVRRHCVRFATTDGYSKAEVTRGGVDTSRLSSKNLESRDVPGLFFIGEVVDVTGWLGGFNFQWAWASGRAAGEAV